MASESGIGNFGSVDPVSCRHAKSFAELADGVSPEVTLAAFIFGDRGRGYARGFSQLGLGHPFDGAHSAELGPTEHGGHKILL